MLAIRKQLVTMGHSVTIPVGTEDYQNGVLISTHGSESAQRKITFNFIRGYAAEIQHSDAILVVNVTRNQIENYIGGNTFWEIGFAHIFGRKIFLLNPIPDVPLYKSEILAVEPVILNGDLSKIT
jgi:hypothetical protein